MHDMRTRSFTHLPATSMIATVVLTATWWLALIGIAGPTTGSLVAVGAAAGIAVLVTTCDAHDRLHALATLVVGIVGAPRDEPPGTPTRWRRLRSPSATSSRVEIITSRVGAPRAPGRVAPTA